MKNAWEVGVDDQDSVAIYEKGMPVIPAEHSKDAPVLELLRRRKSNPRFLLAGVTETRIGKTYLIHVMKRLLGEDSSHLGAALHFRH